MKKNVMLALLLAFVLVGGYYIGKGQGLFAAALPSQCGTSTILGITSATQTTSADLGGKNVIRVLATANGGGECAQISWTAADLKAQLEKDGNKYTVDNGIYGDFSKLKQTQTFPITQNAANVYKKMGITEVPNSFGTCLGNVCAGVPNTIAVVQNGVLGKCECAYFYNYGVDSTMVGGGTKDFNIQFSITNLGSTSISSAVQSAKISDKVFIKWSGDLLSNQWLGNIPYNSVFIYGTNTYRLVDSSAYSLYSNLYTEYQAASKWQSSSFEGYQQNVAQFNSQVENILRDKLVTYEATTPNVDTITPSGNNYVVELLSPMTYPVFTIDIDAASVGIHKVQGVPQLTCPATFEVNSGTTKVSSVTVKNNAPSGTGSAGFSLGATCTNGGTAIFDTSRVNLEGQATQSVNVRTSMLVSSGTKSSTCTLTATDLNSLTQGTCNYDFTAKFVTGCTESVCDGANLAKCNSDGTVTSVPCQYGCIYYMNLPQCALQPTEICDDGADNNANGLIDCKDPACAGSPVCSGTCGNWLEVSAINLTIPNYWCLFMNWLKYQVTVISVIFGILTALVAFLALRKISERLDLKDDLANKIIIVIISILLGFLVGYVTSLYWWAGLISIALFFILRMVL